MNSTAAIWPPNWRRSILYKSKWKQKSNFWEDFILKKYESIFILDIRKVEDEGEAFNKEFAAFIEGLGGRLTEAKAMGRNQFAYEIKKRKGGIYWDFAFELDAVKVIEIKEKYRLDERVLRNMTVADERPEVLRTSLVVEQA